jgi:hypothetical protein
MIEEEATAPPTFQHVQCVVNICTEQVFRLNMRNHGYDWLPHHLHKAVACSDRAMENTVTDKINHMK